MKTTQEQKSILIAHDFIAKNSDVLDQKKIDAAVKAITAKTQSYPANGSIVSFIFYLKFQVNIIGGKSFNGNAGGASTPGAGALKGDVYTSDINRMYKDTISMQFTATPVYSSIIFFDKNSNVLGTFQAGGIGTVAGIGGGTGSWS